MAAQLIATNGPLARGAGVVQGARAQFLAGAALAFEQHRGVGAGGAIDRGHHLPQGRRVADDARTAAARGRFFLQQAVIIQQAALLERARDQQQQVIGIDRLGEKVERALFHRLDGVLDAAVRGHHDHRQLRVELLHRAQHPHAVALGQAEIRQHERGLEILERGDRFRLVARLDDVMALRLERELEHRAQRVLVFDEENREGAHAPGRSQPAGTPARRASSSSAAIFLRLLVQFLLDALELGERGLSIGLDFRALRRIVAVDEVGQQAR